MKKLIAFLTIATMILACIPFTASAATKTLDATYGTPTIDGETSDWAENTNYADLVIVSGTSQADVKVRVMNDEEFVYVLAEMTVADETTSGADSNAFFVFFDDTGSTHTSYNANILGYRYSMSQFKSPFDGANLEHNAEYKWKLNNSKSITYEIKLQGLSSVIKGGSIAMDFFCAPTGAAAGMSWNFDLNNGWPTDSSKVRSDRFGTVNLASAPEPEAPSITVNGETSKDVTAVTVKGTPSETLYAVDISWGSLEFKYSTGDTGTWNATTLEYEGGAPAGWSCEENADKITVSNRSNAPVEVEFGYQQAGTYTGISGTFDTSSASDLILDEVKGTGEGATVDSIAAKLVLSGELAETSEKVTIGSVTVTIAPATVSE